MDATVETKDQDSALENNNLLITIWIFSFCMFICLPFCASKYRRRICLERIKQRRWDVPFEEVFEANPPEWYRHALERYEAIRAAQLAADRLETNASQILSEEQEDEIRRLYLSENMAKFTITLKETDMKDNKGMLLLTMTNSTMSSCSTIMVDDHPKEEQQDKKSVIMDQEADVSLDLEEGKTKMNHDNEDNNNMPLEEYHETTDVCICLPKAGTTTTDTEQEQMRHVPNSCAICLSEMESNERITWASNSDCKHVYHEECVLNWLLAVGRKHARRRRGDQPTTPTDDDHDPIRQAIDFPKLCPTCRLPFIKTDLTDSLPTLATLTASASTAEEDEDLEIGNSSNSSSSSEILEDGESHEDPATQEQPLHQNLTQTDNTRPSSPTTLETPSANENLPAVVSRPE